MFSFRYGKIGENQYRYGSTNELIQSNQEASIQEDPD
jgi:hypothetical protein